MSRGRKKEAEITEKKKRWLIKCILLLVIIELKISINHLYRDCVKKNFCRFLLYLI